MNGSKLTKKIHGKTIESLNVRGMNMWEIFFTDGSSIELWAETDGPYNLATLNLENLKGAIS